MTAIRRKVHGQPCRNCGSKQGIDAAHVIAKSIGGKNRAESVIPLCRECHRATHDHRLEVLPLLRREEEVEAVRVVGIARAYAFLTRGS